MNNFTIINIQALTGTIAIILGFKYWIQPRIANLPIHAALLPFVGEDKKWFFSSLGLSWKSFKLFCAKLYLSQCTFWNKDFETKEEKKGVVQY